MILTRKKILTMQGNYCNLVNLISGVTTWTKPRDLRHIQLRAPLDLEVEAQNLVPDIIPRPAQPPPRSWGHSLHYPVVRRIAAKSQHEDKKEEQGFLWNIWKNSLGSLFEKKDGLDKRSGRTNPESATNPVLDTIGKSLTRMFIKYATNEVTKLLTTENVVRE